MQLRDQWREVERGLPDSWASAALLLRVRDGRQVDRAAALLAPLNAGRTAAGLRFTCARRGSGPSPELMSRLLARIDGEGIEGELELVSTGEAEPRPAPVPHRTLAERWDEEVAALPPDWSDVYAELELASSDYLDRAALLTAPLNPGRHSDQPRFRFRCAARSGYGASPGMVRRCLERLDEAGITADVRILRALADTHHVSTQGPVWYVGGRSV